MSATPGQAAFEVAQARYSPKNRLDWAKIKPAHRESYEAEARAAVDASGLRELVAEIIGEVEGWSRDPLDTDQLIAGWRERGGLEQS